MTSQKVERCAGIVVVGPNAEILLTSTSKKGISLPKGHRDGNETPKDAALRELREEGGISKLTSVRPLGSFVRRKDGSVKVIVLFIGQTKQTKLRPTDSRHTAWWSSLDDAYQSLLPERPRDAMQLLRFRTSIERVRVQVIASKPSEKPSKSRRGRSSQPPRRQAIAA